MCVWNKTRGKNITKDKTKDNYSSVRNIISRSWFNYNFSFKLLTETWPYDFLRKRVNPTHSLVVFAPLSRVLRMTYCTNLLREISRVKILRKRVNRESDESPTLRHQGLPKCNHWAISCDTKTARIRASSPKAIGHFHRGRDNSSTIYVTYIHQFRVSLNKNLIDAVTQV